MDSQWGVGMYRLRGMHHPPVTGDHELEAGQLPFLHIAGVMTVDARQPLRIEARLSRIDLHVHRA